MSCSNCCFLTCIQVSQEANRWSGIAISLRIFHSLLWSSVKGFSTVNETEVDIFLEFSSFFDDPVDVSNLISDSSAFSKTSLNIWKFTVHILLKPGLENFEHYFTSMWNKHNCVVVWIFFGIALLWDWNENFWNEIGMKTFHWNENRTFSSRVATAEFSKFAGILNAALSQHHLLGFEIAQLQFHHFH